MSAQVEHRDAPSPSATRHPINPRRLLRRLQQHLLWSLRARHVVRRMRGQLEAHLPQGNPQVTIRSDPEIAHMFDAVLRRDDDGIVVHLPQLTHRDSYWTARHYLAAYAYWLHHCPPDVDTLSVTLSDGQHPSAARFAPSTNVPDMIAIPDPHFYANHGFAAERRAAETQGLAWADRSDAIVWRGATTGTQSYEVRLFGSAPHHLAPRLRLCLNLRNVPGTDVRFSRNHNSTLTLAALAAQGLTGPAIEQRSWLRRKFAVDVDGHTNTWSNLLVRLHYGCCVLKVESGHGYRQWYYDRLNAWEHYVPVRPDMSDLLERIDWVRTNDAACREIALRGQALARTLSMESATAEAVQLIGGNWKEYGCSAG